MLLQVESVDLAYGEVPACRDIEQWAVLTIGTGLGNARFTNRKDD